jgi:hypothetical protein
VENEKLIPLLIFITPQAFYWYGECYNIGYGKRLQSDKFMLLSQLDEKSGRRCKK